MAQRVRKVSYCYAEVPSRAGRGAGMLNALRDADVDLLAFTGFPAGGGKAQIDFVSDDLAGVRRGARQQGWKLSKTFSSRVTTASVPATGCWKSSWTRRST